MSLKSKQTGHIGSNFGALRHPLRRRPKDLVTIPMEVFDDETFMKIVKFVAGLMPSHFLSIFFTNWD